MTVQFSVIYGETRYDTYQTGTSISLNNVLMSFGNPTDYPYDRNGVKYLINNIGPGRSQSTIYGMFMDFTGTDTLYTNIVGLRVSTGTYDDLNLTAIGTSVDENFATGATHSNAKIHISIGNGDRVPGKWGIIDRDDSDWFSLFFSGACQEGLVVDEDFTDVTWGAWLTPGVK
jgi:hypothetical protein